MPDSPTRLSPIHGWFEPLKPEWGQIGEMPIAIRIHEAEEERTAMQRLALCDLSALTKLGVKGPRAESWQDVEKLVLEALANDGRAIQQQLIGLDEGAARLHRRVGPPDEAR